MKRKNFVLLICAVIVAVAALVALSKEEPTENVLPEEGLLLCEIEGVPYYYDAEYLFKVTGSVFPAEPSVSDKKLAVFYELAYLESVASDAYVTSDRMESEIKKRKADAKTAEDYLADPDGDGAMTEYFEEYLSTLNTCAEKEGTTPNVFWDDIAPYVEKGILISIYTDPLFDDFMANGSGDMEAYPAYLLEYFDPLVEKYDVTFIDDEL
ncbi:MAG: hypothetical protein IIY02_04925 [Firmicutes bacterium]|nr:hypothetical protein [Bacillota bacterium]